MNIKTPPTKSIVEQITNNATSWIGHRKSDNNDIIGGQTFIAPSEEDIEAIEVLTSIVMTPGNVVMTIHNFDPNLKSWGPVLQRSSLELNKGDNGKWKAFNTSGLHLNKGKVYGFRLESPDSYIGVGESVVSYQTPLTINGQEWRFINKDQKGQAFSYFSLAFKVAVRA